MSTGFVSATVCLLYLFAMFSVSCSPTLSELGCWELGWRDHRIITQGSPGVHGPGPSQAEGQARGQACVNSCALF